MRQENACLTLQDEQLIRDFDAVQYELPSFGSQVQYFNFFYSIVYQFGINKVLLSILCERMSHNGETWSCAS